MGLKMNELSIRGTFLLIWVRFILLVCLFFYFGTFLFNFFYFVLLETTCFHLKNQF